MEHYISVDIETAGPNPADYAMLSIGACHIASISEDTFYLELQPTTMAAQPNALRVSGLSMARLAAEGVPPGEAMAQFVAWIGSHVPAGERPIFVGHNAPFDWMFVADYFHRFLGFNPFGHSALDLKSFYMAFANVPFHATGLAQIAERYQLPSTLSHHALMDAQDQARLLQRMLDELEHRESRSSHHAPTRTTENERST
ncbi:MAG: 3'-5' exonuclease [Anaerolineales bacterium]|nr:3'-5' exonuclease [Anaerolineales bacterium]